MIHGYNCWSVQKGQVKLIMTSFWLFCISEALFLEPVENVPEIFFLSAEMHEMNENYRFQLKEVE